MGKRENVCTVLKIQPLVDEVYVCLCIVIPFILDVRRLVPSPSET